jgi:DNA repair photolyase
MEQDKNIVEKASKELNKRLRKAMENRLTEYINLDISKINWNLPKKTAEEVMEQEESLEQETKAQVNEQKKYYTGTLEIQEDEKIKYGG